MESQRDTILCLATAFRRAIEVTPTSELPITFADFPRGSGGDATLLLAKVLEEHGCGAFDYVLGEREGHSHAWLQQGELVIDITPDQCRRRARAGDRRARLTMARSLWR